MWRRSPGPTKVLLCCECGRLPARQLVTPRSCPLRERAEGIRRLLQSSREHARPRAGGRGGREPPLTRGMALRRNHTPCASATRSLVPSLNASQGFPARPAVCSEPGVGQGRGSTVSAAVFRARTRRLRGQAAQTAAPISGQGPALTLVETARAGPPDWASRAERVDSRGVRPRREHLAAVQRPHQCPATRAERRAARGLPSPGVLVPVDAGCRRKRDVTDRVAPRLGDETPDPRLCERLREIGPWPQLPPQEVTTHPGPTRGSRRTPVQPSHRASQRRPDPRRGSLQPAHRTGKRRASAPSRRLAAGGPSPLGRLGS